MTTRLRHLIDIDDHRHKKSVHLYRKIRYEQQPGTVLNTAPNAKDWGVGPA